MNKDELLKRLDELDFPKEDYYLLSSGCLMLYGMRESIGDIDLCVSEELFEELRVKYNLTEDKKDDCGFYDINEYLSVVPGKKESMQYNIKDGIRVEKLETILDFKLKRNYPKDQKDIENITNYLKEQTT